MGEFHYLKAGHWGLSTDEGNQQISFMWHKFLYRPSRQSALKFLRDYQRYTLRNKEAAGNGVLEVVHYRMQVMCQEHGLPLDELWNAIIRIRNYGEDENCEGV